MVDKIEEFFGKLNKDQAIKKKKNKGFKKSETYKFFDANTKGIRHVLKSTFKGLGIITVSIGKGLGIMFKKFLDSQKGGSGTPKVKLGSNFKAKPLTSRRQGNNEKKERPIVRSGLVNIR